MTLLAIAACTRATTPAPAPALASAAAPSPAPAPAPEPALSSGPAPSAAPSVRLDGRFDLREPNAPRFSWPGTAIVARFSGTRAAIRLKDVSSLNPPIRRNHYTVVIDDRPPTTFSVKRNTDRYALAENLAPGVHVVRVVRNTEAHIGEAQFLGFDFGPDGELLAPPPVARRIEVIGDSITCGYGVEGADGTCHYTAGTENAFLAYGSIAARALDATATLVAYSAIGVYRNNSGGRNGTMPMRYPRSLADDTKSTWDFASAPQADAVVINLGTNDFAPGTPPEAEFAAAYRELLALVRKAHPRAHVFCAIGPMLTDVYPTGAETLTKARRYVSNIVAAAADPRVHVVEFAPMDVAKEGAGCDFHPSAKTHARMGAQLAREIKSA